MATVARTLSAAAARGAEANMRCEAEVSASPTIKAGLPVATLIFSEAPGRALAHHGLAVMRAPTVGISSRRRMCGMHLCHEAALAAGAVALTECMPRPPSENLR